MHDDTQATVQRSFGGDGQTGTLYLVATPIGNLEDMTFRAIRILKDADLIAAEDTRHTRKLLTHFDISARLVSYHDHNQEASGRELIRLLESGSQIALVSDAGIPAISDPGAELVAEAVRRQIPVVPIPGANAALSALIVSGLPTARFLFVGFPPRSRKEQEQLLDSVEKETGTLLFYESPHRLKKTVETIAARWGDRRMAIVRELTKRYEEVIRGTAQACLAILEQHPPLGECCIVLEGRSGLAGDQAGPDDAWWVALSYADHVGHYEAQGEPRKEAMKSAAKDRGVSRREIYQALLDNDEER